MEQSDQGRRKSRVALAVLVALLVAAPVVVMNRGAIRAALKMLPFVRQAVRQKTAEEQIAVYGAVARGRLVPEFKAAGVEYPADRLALVALKDVRELQIYAAKPGEGYKFVRAYPVLGASGHLGPKLRMGDCQVPEGIYSLALEPNTPYHLALRLNYPNDYDRQQAQEDGRDPGSDILIHGTEGSVGCLAMGDQASEDLFVMAYDAKDRSVPLVICPTDLRVNKMPEAGKDDPKWIGDLYARIKEKLGEFPVAGK